MCQLSTRKAKDGEGNMNDQRRWQRMTIRSLIWTCLGASIASFCFGIAVRHLTSSSTSLKVVVVSEDDVATVQAAAPAKEMQQFIWKQTQDDDDDNEDEEDEEENDESVEEEDEVDKEDEEMHYHLRMSLKDMVPDFIGSEEALYDIMTEVEDEFDLDLVTYGCQSLPHGATIRCYGILEDGGSMALYAFPQSSALLFDLLVEDEIDIDDLDVLETIFKQTMDGSETEIKYIHFPFGLDSSWSIRQRGVYETVSDISQSFEDSSENKKLIASIQSPFQKIEVIDFFTREERVNLRDGLQNHPQYVMDNPDLFVADRVLFLDGVSQSARTGNAAYHESLVQPAMFAHANPKRVAIIGGGECATLREVLKHNTLDKVIMIDIDPVIVEASKVHLPDWNDCSNFDGSSRYCMDDPRAEVIAEDAFKWFIDRFGENPTIEGEAPFDVIILDALDPQNVVDFAEALYGDSSFLGSLYNGLSKDGILVSQVGEQVGIDDPAETYSINRYRALFVDSMTAQGFVAIEEYDEPGAQFEAPWVFNIMFKSLVSRYHWDDTEAMVALKMVKRAIKTLDGKSPFEFFDGADMQRRLPSKAAEVVFCRQEPTPPGCLAEHGFDPARPNLHAEIGCNSTNVCLAESMIDGGFYMMLEEAVHQVSIQLKTKDLISASGSHNVFRKSSLSRLNAFQQTNSYKESDMDGSFKIDTDLTPYTKLANMSDYRRNVITDRDYVYNPATARNSNLRNAFVLDKKEIEDRLSMDCSVSPRMDARTIS